METLYPGSRGTTVQMLQQLLNYLGYESPNNGVFCEKTLLKVIEFQCDVCISPDGIVGDYTWTYLVKMRAFKETQPEHLSQKLIKKEFIATIAHKSDPASAKTKPKHFRGYADEMTSN